MGISTLGGDRRRYIKQQFGKMQTGSLVSDQETQQFADKARETAQAATGAQTSMLNRAAAANTAGSPVVAGAIKDAAGQVAKSNINATVSASGQASQFREAIAQQRRAETMQRVQGQIAQNREDLGLVLDTAAVVGHMVWED